MSQIEIDIVKQGIKTGNVLSCSLFKMASSYRDFSRYEQSLKLFLAMSTRLENFEVRIYTDDTAVDSCLRISEQYPTVSVYRYVCPQFQEEIGHAGTFGSIVRFLPLFEKGLSTVWISDIDVNKYMLDPLILVAMKRYKCSVHIASMLCYARRPWANVKYPIVAHRFVSTITYPKQILTRFLNRLTDGDFSETISNINTYNSVNSRKTTNDQFPYGMDEVFMNGLLYRNLKQQNIPILLTVDYFVPNLLSYNSTTFRKEEGDILMRYYKNETPDLFRMSKEIFKKHLPMITDKYPCATEMIRIFDKLKTSFVLTQVIQSTDL